MVFGKLPTIPEYYKDFINADVDLLEQPSQCCPFHKEKTPSFTFSAEKGLWRCWGACKVGGDIYALHQKNYGLANRDEAIKSLNSLYKIQRNFSLDSTSRLLVDEDKVELETLQQKAIILANCPDRWKQLDVVMSKYPVDKYELMNLIEEWGYEITFE